MKYNILLFVSIVFSFILFIHCENSSKPLIGYESGDVFNGFKLLVNRYYYPDSIILNPNVSLIIQNSLNNVAKVQNDGHTSYSGKRFCLDYQESKVNVDNHQVSVVDIILLYNILLLPPFFILIVIFLYNLY
ncbi:expressed protein [Dictyostelium purpureum]|uniref:Expressed protein n=1 Tax=Dictyostelium purpureum TaxID=5786 RepID=F0Z6Q8_DICPU|nr:uncharacterized protein DICPUDRAFT_91039 [Dictyostelium purpureum]EGC40352.1 expressed protein [Dictyostelium purpureum]|eukprot:XP_003283103.1 expressed protein [Dictyostelium purpureum]